jgi:outer membrane lipoprotein-sorting protein
MRTPPLKPPIAPTGATTLRTAAAIAFALPTLLIGVGRARAADGLQIFQEAVRRDAGYHDYKADVTMVLKEKADVTSTRKLEVSNLEVKNDGARTLIAFDSPADVKGTKVLTASHPDRADEQWIYLPAFSRVKQISTAGQTASFMGSEFSYEDLNSINVLVAKFTYTFLRDEVEGGAPCFVVERRPRYESSAYVREVVWVDKTDYVMRKVEFYDRDAKPFKILTATGYKKYLGKYLRADEMRMENLRSGKSTVLRWERYRFDGKGVSEADFAVSALKRQ